MKTNDLLLELGTEELPPKSLLRLSRTLADAMGKGLDKAQLAFDAIEPFATPRRLAVLVRGLAEQQPDQHIEKRGPAVKAAFDDAGAPTKAALGFARSCGVEDVNSLERMETEKGEWLVFRDEQPGQPVSSLIAGIIESAVDSLPIERAMRWGTSLAEFVRPVHWVVLLYGKEVLPAVIRSRETGRITRGHRFMSNGDIELSSANDYEKALHDARVVASFEQRRDLIREQLASIGKEQSAEVVIDPALLDEVTALVEWPVALCGEFDPAFLKVPEEALVSAMKSHQRYFHLVDAEGHLLPKFITIANLESKDPGAVIAGNERVIAPRLSDASFFFTQDAKISLEARLEQLRQIVFQSSLGSYYDKANRIASLAAYIANACSNDSEKARRAGLLCKSDLVTDMVGEFPELQGIMGGYYADSDGEAPEIGRAIAEHYRPVQSGGELPTSLEGQCVAIADKLDTLTGLFGIGQPPTGSRDPFALRRQALGAMRICIEGELAVDLIDLVEQAALGHDKGFETHELVAYLLERLAVSYQEEGIGSDTFNAVRNAHESPTVLAVLDRQVRALHAFREHPQAEALVAANKRVANILKQAGISGEPDLDTGAFVDPAESALYEALLELQARIAGTPDFEARLLALADLQPVIDRYFDDVLVMAEDNKVKQNRIATLAHMRRLFLNVADVSLLQM